MYVRSRGLRNVALLTALVGLVLVPVGTAGAKHGQQLDIQLLAINDIHGQVTTGRTVTVNGQAKPVGGAAYVQAYIEREKQDNPERTLVVHGGDAVGASQAVSALLQDEPIMDALNEMGVDVGVVGNHEFDEGVPELMRLLNGGCHPKTQPMLGCFEGADFPTLAANVVYENTGKTILPPYVIEKIRNVRLGFIGVVTTETPQIVIPSAVQGLKFLDEAETVNRYIPELKRQGVEAIIVLAHLGGSLNAQQQVTGEIVEFANAVNDEVDVIISGHTHQGYASLIDGKLVTQAFSYSTALADIDLVIDRDSGEVTSKAAEIITTFNEGVTPDREMAALVSRYEKVVGPSINRVVGTAKNAITRDPSPAGEQPLGNLIADAQRWQTKTDFAFMNPGGIRADLNAGEVTVGELFAVQPFGNDLVTMNLTGQQVYDLLNQQWQGTRTRFLQISGLEYDYKPNAATGSRIVEVRIPGKGAIDRNATYSATVNIFLAGGGDAFTVLTKGTNRVTGAPDIDALIPYVQQLQQPFDAAVQNRIRIVSATP